MMLISKIEMSVTNKMADVFVGNFINWRTLISRQVNSISHTRCSSRIHVVLTRMNNIILTVKEFNTNLVFAQTDFIL